MYSILVRLARATALCTFVAATGSAFGGIIASEDFDYADPKGKLTGGTGFSSAWQLKSTDVMIRDGKMAFAGGSSKDRSAARSLSSEVAQQKTIYLGVDVSTDAPGDSATVSAMISLGKQGVSEIGANKNLLSFGIYKGNLTAMGSFGTTASKKFGAYSPGKPVRLVLKCQFEENGTLKVTLWADPPSDEPSAEALEIPNAPFQGFDRIFLRSWESDPASSSAFDNLKVGTEWSDVAGAGS